MKLTDSLRMIHSHSMNEIIFNNILFRKMPSGYYISQSKTNAGRKTVKGLHVAVWEFYSGKNVPKGYLIHHIDHDKSNNDFSNLECITYRQHAKEHPGNSSFSDLAREEAKKWHRSKDGIDWHRSNATNQWIKAKGNPIIKKCENCGIDFECLISTRMFCSPRCQQKKNAKIEVSCIVCNITFSTNKYRPAKTCSRACFNRIYSQ